MIRLKSCDFDCSYTAIFEGHVPMMRQKVYFEKGAVKELPSTGLMPWKEHRHMMNGRSTIIFFEYFKVPAEYYNMMKPAKTPKTIK